MLEFGTATVFNRNVIASETSQSVLLDEITTSQASRNDEIIFNTTPQPAFNKQFNLLIEDLNTNYENGYTNYIACVSEQQAKRFHDIFDDSHLDVKEYQTIILSLHQGFIDHDNKIVCYTDHQIFERYHKFHLKNGYAKKQAITLKELTNLEIGDYVTHIDHGIGKFGGLQKIDVEGKKQEAIKLIYGERDILYISIHSLHKISKYNGKDGKAPKLHKLGSKVWKNLKQKTKSRIRHIAYNLIELYAKRKFQKGFQYQPDSYLQHELEASFLYEDTPDQSSSTQDVKNDMESEQPMDRLVCGDVGFGKTEIAIRAAFKAVDNGKQVAILVPTTILAFQHFKTFSERLSEMPVNVDYLNRFRTAKQRTSVLDRLKNGTLDIVIGTHQLVNKAVQFKDLGLLILRVGASILMLTHGIGKLQKLIADPSDFGDPIGLGPTISLILVVLGEFVAPLLIIVGYKTKLAAIPPFITMLVAALIVHGSDPFGKKEKAIIYGICFLVISITGAGKYSIDKK